MGLTLGIWQLRLDSSITVSIISTVSSMLSNTHFSIAVHVLSALAYREGEVLGSDELAATVGTNPSFLRGLIAKLKGAGLVGTQMGKGGGATLLRSAKKITLEDVYLATENQPGFKTHGCCDASPCPVAANMSSLLAQINQCIEKAVASELKRTTIDDLVKKHLMRE